MHNQKLNGLDHLRALAITLVFFFHYRIFPHPTWLDNSFFAFGWTGVDLFFVLSGFLIAGQLLAQEEISLKTFYTKRVFRIFPAYFTIVFLYFCFPPLREREALPPLWKFITFTQNIGLDLKNHGTFSHAWSLCIEEQFYLLLPLILVFIPRKAAAWLMGILFIAGFGIRYYCYHHFYLPATTDNWKLWYQWIYYPTFSRLDGLLAGVALAAIYKRVEKYGNYLLLAGLVILITSWYICQNEDLFNETIFGFPLIALGYACLVGAAASPATFLYRYSSRITASIATLSYSLYLSHKIVIHVTQSILGKYGIPENSTGMFVFCTVTCLLAALLLRYLIEKPFLRLRDKVLQRTPVLA